MFRRKERDRGHGAPTRQVHSAARPPPVRVVRDGERATTTQAQASATGNGDRGVRGARPATENAPSAE